MLPLISIIIPIYNAEKDLPKCIESCCNQTHSKLEIILVNDGSSDNCSSICHDYASKDSRIIVIDKENSGVSDTRNTGIKSASGEFIMFVDADDWIEPETIEKMVAFQAANNLDLTTAGITLYRNHSIYSDILPEKEVIHGTAAISKHLANSQKITYYRPPVVKLFKHSLLKENNIQYDVSLKLNEDFIFVLDYLKVCKSIGTLNASFYNYNQTFTSEKTQHYGYQDVRQQWNLNLLQFRIYKSFFVNLQTYDENSFAINTFLITRIRGFLTSVILADGNSKTIKAILREINVLPEYPDIQELKYKNISDKIEKYVLFCCKHKLWMLLYFSFKCKNALYNRRIYKN